MKYIVVFFLVSNVLNGMYQVQRNMKKAIFNNRVRTVKKLWKQYNANDEFKWMALSYATQICRAHMIDFFLQEGNFCETQLTQALSSVFQWGLCLTCCTCKNSKHSTENHSSIMAKLIKAGADGNAIYKTLEQQQLSLTDVVGYVRRDGSLKELEGALAMQKENQ